MKIVNNTDSILFIHSGVNNFEIPAGESCDKIQLNKDSFDTCLHLIELYEDKVQFEFTHEEKVTYRWKMHIIPEANLAKSEDTESTESNPKV